MLKKNKLVGLERVFLVFLLCTLFVCDIFALEKKVESKRIVVLDPAVVEMMYMLDAQDQIVAISRLSMSKIWPEDKTVHLNSVGTYTKPNFEKIVELKPDLVITSFHSANVNEDLKKFNLPTLTFKANSVDEIMQNIEEMGKVTGKEDKARDIVANIKNKIETFKDSKLKGKKIIAFFSSTPITAFSSKTLPGDMFNKLGLINLADQIEGSTPVISPEFILAKDPDYIVIIGGMGGESNFLKKNPAISKTTAAKNNKILNISSSILLRGTPRIGDGIETVYKMMSDE